MIHSVSASTKSSGVRVIVVSEDPFLQFERCTAFSTCAVTLRSRMGAVVLAVHQIVNGASVLCCHQICDLVAAFSSWAHSSGIMSVPGSKCGC